MNLDLLLEAERRGILPADKVEMLAEARKRGLIAQSPQGGSSTNSQAVDELKQKIKASLAGGINTATLGFADEASGVVSGLMNMPGDGTFMEGFEGGRDAVRNENERLQSEEPGPYGAGQVAGALGTAFVPGAQIATLPRSAGIAPRVAASSAAGAAAGGAYGFGQGEGMDRRLRQAGTGMALGGAIGAGTPAAGSAIQRFLDGRAATRAVKGAPETDSLRTMAQAAFQRADEAAPIPRQKFAEFADQTRNVARSAGHHPDLTPKSQTVLNQIDEAANLQRGETIGFNEIETLRRQAQSPAGLMGDAAEQNVGSTIIRSLDDFMERADDMGPAAKEARDLWKRMRQSELVEDAMERANRAASGFENGIRNEFRSILNNKRKSRGLSPAVKSAMEEVVQGSRGGNALRRIGRLMGAGMGVQTNMLGAGLSSAAGAGLGAATGIPGGGMLGAAIPVVLGNLAQRGAQASTQRGADVVSAMIRSGSNKLPVATDATRKAIEAMIRNSGAVAPQ